MFIQPVPLKQGRLYITGSRDHAQALTAHPTLALESLHDRPLGAGVEESKFVAHGKRPVVSHADLEADHVEDQGGLARVGAVDKVGVEFNAGIGTIGYGGIGNLGAGVAVVILAKSAPAGRAMRERADDWKGWSPLRTCRRSG